MASRENPRKPPRQVLCTIPVRQTTCPVFQPAFQVYGFRKRESGRGLWSFEDKHFSEVTQTTDTAKNIDTRVESIINAYNINLERTRGNLTDAMPLGKALRTKKPMTSRNQAKGKSPDDPNQKKNQVAFAVQNQDGQSGCPDRRYPPTPYIDRRRLPPRKLKHDTNDETSNLRIQGTSPTCPVPMFLEQPRSPTGKSLMNQDETEYQPSPSPKKTTCLHIQDLHMKGDVQKATLNAASKFNADGESVSPPKSFREAHKNANLSTEQVRFINIAQSYCIDNDIMGDMGRNRNKNTNNYPEKNDVNYSNNHAGMIDEILGSNMIDAILGQFLHEADGRDFTKSDIDDALKNYIISNDDDETDEKIASLPSDGAFVDDPNNCTAINIYQTKSEPCVDHQKRGVGDLEQAWTKNTESSAPYSVESASSETLVPESLCSGNISDVEGIQDLSEYSDAHWRESEVTSPEMSAPVSPWMGSQKYATLASGSLEGKVPRSPKSSTTFGKIQHQPEPWLNKQNEYQEMAQNNSTYLSYDSFLEPTSSKNSFGIKNEIKQLNTEYPKSLTDSSSQYGQRRAFGNSSELDSSASRDSLDFGRAYGVVYKSPMKKSAEEREELQNFFRDTRGPIPKSKMSHFAKTGHFLYHLYKHGKLADVHIRLHNQSFRAHSAVLAAHSDYLACLLLNEGTPIYNLQLRDCITSTALTILLEYMYTGELAIKDNTVVEVLSATLALQMKAERDSCRQYIENVDPSMLLKLWLQANQHNLNEDAANLLKANATNFLKVTVLHDFSLLPLERVLELLSREDLYIRTELDVAHAGMRWVQYDSENRSQHISSIMDTVRLQHMKLQEVHSLANEAPELMNSESRADLLNVCWFLSSKQEQLPHQLGDIQIPANRVKILELRREAGRNVQDEVESDFLLESYLPPICSDSPRRSYEDGLTNQSEDVKSQEQINQESSETVQVMPEVEVGEPQSSQEIQLESEFTSNTPAISREPPTPDVDELDLWCKGKASSNVRAPSIGEIWPTLKNYISGKSASTLVLIGGYDPSQDQDNLTGLTMLCLNEDMSGFCLQGLLPEGRIHHVTEYFDQKIYIIGGMDPTETADGLVSPKDTVFVYDLNTAEWKEGPPLNNERSHHGSCILGNSIYVIGGQDKRPNVLSSVERYDLQTKSWAEVANMPEGRLGPSVVALKDKILIIGGCGQGEDEYVIHDSILLYKPAADTWTEICSQLNILSRCYATAAVHNDKIWVSGGVTPSRSLGHPLCCSLGLVESYEPSTGVWSPVEEDLTVPRHHATSAVVEGRLVILGGLSTKTNTATKVVETYDIENKLWRDLIELPRPLMGGRVVVVPPNGHDS